MPALVYGVAGNLLASGNTSLSIGTVVAFTTLQTRLFFPVSSLLSVQTDVQSSLALFERVFEYLDLPVEIDERPGARPSTARGSGAGWSSTRRLRLRGGPAHPEHISFVAEPGTKVALVGETGSGKTTVGYLAARLYEPSAGAVADRRPRPARPELPLAARHDRRRQPGDLSVPRIGAREPALRPTWRRPRRSSRRPLRRPASTTT